MASEEQEVHRAQEEAGELGGWQTGWCRHIILLSLEAAEDETVAPVAETRLCNSRRVSRLSSQNSVFIASGALESSGSRAVIWPTPLLHQLVTSSRSVDEFLSLCLGMPLWCASNLWAGTALLTASLQCTSKNYKYSIQNQTWRN